MYQEETPPAVTLKSDHSSIEMTMDKLISDKQFSCIYPVFIMEKLPVLSDSERELLNVITKEEPWDRKYKRLK